MMLHECVSVEDERAEETTIAPVKVIDAGPVQLLL
jgi:hypothetical protein